MVDINTSRIPFDDIPQLSKTDNDYATRPEIFSDWIEHLPGIESFHDVIEKRANFQVDRNLLVKTIKEQYTGLGHSADHADALLDSSQFTVTTAHQPALLTGPLYFIYKICSTINLAEQLNQRYPENGFHPVLIIGGEDHDFEEINHLNLFGKTFTWENDQQGAVGRMRTDSLEPVISAIKSVLGSSPYAGRLSELIDSAFGSDLTYGQAMQKFVIELFEHTPLIVLQMDNAGLKGAFIPVMREELFERNTHELISASQAELELAGYKPQAYLREINLFYLHDQLRSRIECDEEGTFRIVDTNLVFSPAEMEQELNTHPERFSPNVNLRPVYQETILPNLAYIGGGGEIAYWLERKTQFEHCKVPYPMLIRRNSVLHINKGMRKLREKLEISLSALFAHPDSNIAEWIRAHTEHEIDIQEETAAIETAIEKIRAKAQELDPSLATKIDAFKVKTLKEVDNLGKRLVRAEKGQHELTLQKIQKLHEKLFPGMGLQERHDNFIQFYLVDGQDYLDLLIRELDPLQQGFIILEEGA